MNHEPLRIHYVNEGERHVPTPSHFAHACSVAGISQIECRADRRQPDLVRKRFHVMWLLRQRGWSYPHIGREMERTHAAILFGVRRYEALAGRENVNA